MKKAFSLMFLMLCLTAFTQCSDDSEDPISITEEENFVKVTLRSAQTLDYSLGIFGYDEDGASIIRQPASFEKSFMERKNYVEMIYHYTPEKNFTGNVLVELRSNRSFNFQTMSHDEVTFTKIEITVIE